VKSWLLAVLAACGAPRSAPPPIHDPVAGRTPDGANVELAVVGDRITRVGDGRGTTWLWPPIIDSHVHLAYWPVADQLAESGVAAVVDLAAPERMLGASSPIHVIGSGPMLTRVAGYPLESWGRDGYGAGCGDAACVTATIDRLAAAGARVVKLALDDHGLDPALVPIAIEAAHRRRLVVAVHALSNASAKLAGTAGADLLAHTPVEPLATETIAAWRGKAVVSTLAAFGGNDAAIANLRALRAVGVTVLYGTDLGNLRDAGPSRDEVAMLRAAGLDDAAITEAMTTAPARFWGLPFHLAAGAEATFLVLDRDPRSEAEALLAPDQVWIRGRRLR
jgi:imidazolonepropionase-like amidohydrolase